MDSHNSSKPPSSDGMEKKNTKSTRGKSGKKPGGQKGHKGHGLKLDREPDEVLEIKPTECPECGAQINDCDCSHVDTRYLFRLASMLCILQQYLIYKAVCPNCGATVKPNVPKELGSSMQYGNDIRALALMLVNYAMVSVDKTHKILSDILGVPISTGTIQGMNNEFGKAGEATAGQIRSELLNADVLHFDETGMRVNGRNFWFHSASNTRCTLISASQKRGCDGIDAGGVLPDYKGISVHDCWSPYFKYEDCIHALCNAHLLRELIAAEENSKQKWATEMKELLLAMKKAVERYKEDGKSELSYYYTKKFRDQYIAILELGYAENPDIHTKHKRSKAENLLLRFDKHREAITRFAADFDVPFDNNQAERDIRNIKVKSKVSGGFRTEKGAKSFSVSASIIGTAVKQSKNIMNALKNVLAGREVGFAE